jgi:hypothetical protein
MRLDHGTGLLAASFGGVNEYTATKRGRRCGHLVKRPTHESPMFYFYWPTERAMDQNAHGFS